jgi:predicted RNA binding protein YcfA (HicA-like mRNA interferase family)
MGQRIPMVSWKECDKALKKDGWYEVRQSGDHHHYIHPTKPGLVTIPERATFSHALAQKYPETSKTK